jgi:hypothetical protein
MPEETEIPLSIRRFLHTSIHSAAQLEVLLLLARNEEKEWSAAEVSRSLASSPEIAAPALAALEKLGLLTHTDNSAAEPLYLYAPADRTLRRIVEALAVLYQKRRFSVLDLIYATDETIPP